MNKKFVMKPLLAAMLLALAPWTSQAAGPAVPDAGAILQQLAPVTPPAPAPAGTGLTIKRDNRESLPSSAPFLVKSIRIIGNKKIDTATLHALVAEGEGKTLTLAELDKLVLRITEYYNAHGFPLARAIIPAQTMRDGVVTVQIIVARYGKVSLDNHSPVKDPLLKATLAPLQGDQDIEQAPLDRTMLLMSDIPGVTINATLKPGEAVGTSDLLVNVTPGPAITGNAMMDNYGNRYTGRARLGATVNVLNPLQHGDVLNLSVLSSGGGVNYGHLGYETLVNGMGTRLGGSVSALHYILGAPLDSLNAHGTAQVASLWARHPLVRSRDLNLTGVIQYDHLKLSDRIDTSAIQTDRHLDNLTASLAGDRRDAFLAGGITTWNAGWTAGRVSFDDATAQLADAATARTEGSFSKWSATLARLQSLGVKNSLYLAVTGQWANTNLDSAQKMTAGGPYSVRAYDVGAVSGDTGASMTAELRRDLGSAWDGQWQAVAFIDSAHVTINKTAWIAGPNSATLSGAGVGLNWAGLKQWNAKLFVAAPIGGPPTLVGSTNSARAWVEVGKGF